MNYVIREKEVTNLEAVLLINGVQKGFFFKTALFDLFKLIKNRSLKPK
jgi:hypothetical protein